MPTVTIGQTVTVYQVTCTKAFYGHEVGTRHRLTPWGEDAPDIQGYDDGGRKYCLPDGYEILVDPICGKGIYRTSDLLMCALITRYDGKPAVVDGDAYRIIPLQEAK